jgi:hypothetical protein
MHEVLDDVGVARDAPADAHRDAKDPIAAVPYARYAMKGAIHARAVIVPKCQLPHNVRAPIRSQHVFRVIAQVQ